MKQIVVNTILLLIFTVLISFNPASASDYYWVGGTGNWSDLSHWATSSGGSTFHTQVPQSSDNVFFDNNSFTATGQTVTIDPTIVNCNNMDFSGVTYNPSVTLPSNYTLSIYGSLTFVPGMTVGLSGSVVFAGTTTGLTVTSAGKSFNKVYFSGAGGEWTLQDSFKAGELYLNAGTLRTNNQTVNIGIFNSTSGSARALYLGSSIVNVSTGGDVWKVSASGMTLDAGTSTINFTWNSAGWNVIFYAGGGGLTYYDLNWTGTENSYGRIYDGGNTFHNVTFASGGLIYYGSNTFNNVTFYGNGTIYDNNTFNNLTFTAGHSYSISDGKTQTINGIFTANGTCAEMITIASSNATIKKTSGSVVIDYINLQGITATGGATFTANNTVDLGSNTGWTINTLASRDLYWIGGTGNWSDSNHWSLTSGGSAYGCLPTSLDNVFFDANSFSTSGQTVTIDAVAKCKSMNWTGATHNPVFETQSNSYSLSIYGSLTFIPDMTVKLFGNVVFAGTTSGLTITSAGKIFSSNSFAGNVYFSGAGGEWILQDAFGTYNELYVNSGTLRTNNQTVTVGKFISESGSTRSIYLGSSVVNITESGDVWKVNATGMTFDAGTSTINFTWNSSGSTIHFYGGDLNYYDVNWTGAGLGAGYGRIYTGNNTFHDVTFASQGLIFTGSKNTFNSVIFYGNGTIYDNNTFNNLTFTAGYSYSIVSGKTETINGTFTANGTCAKQITISSSASATISKASGTVTINYINLKGITATGGATFIANNTTDLGNNTGWTINTATAKDLYWIGGTGNWSDGNHWSLTSGGSPYGCAPVINDNVFFDANSFPSPGQTVTIDVLTANCNNMDWTGTTNNPTFTGPLSNTLSVHGTSTFVPGMTIDFSGTLNLYSSLTFFSGMTVTFNGSVVFAGTATGQTVTTAGKSFGNAYFSGTGGEWIMQDAFTSGNLYLNAGTLRTNNQTVNVGKFTSKSGSVRALYLGSSVVNASACGEFWEVTAAGMTLDAGTSTINATCNSVGWNVDFTGGGLTYYDVNWTGTAAKYGRIYEGDNSFHDVTFASTGLVNGSNTFHDVVFYGDGSIYDNNTYNDLTFTPGHTYSISSGKTQTINGDLNITGNGTFPIRIQSGIFFKASGMVCADFIRLSDNTATGGATFYAGANSEDMGGNTGWIFSAGSGGTASVTISSTPSGAICSGTEVQFTADAVNGGSSPAYQWKKNGVDVGNTATYNDNTLANNDVIKCEMTSNSSCVSGSVTVADSVTIQITPGGTAGNITSARDTICSGTPGILTLTGNSGNIQWQSSTNQTDYTDISGASSNNYSDIPTQTTYYRVISGRGSCADTSGVFELVVNPSPVADFSYIVSGKQVSFTDNSIDATVHEWDFADGATSNDINPTHTYTADGTYHVCLTVYNGSNCSFTNCQDITAGVTGINEIGGEGSFEIYPNPVSGVLTIKGENNKDIRSIGLYDVLGRLVLDKRFSKTQSGITEINTTGLAEGIYYLRIQTKETNYTQSILKL